ncbi:hypothetical protein DOTSEDRAFT_153101 [Dothistroma septosporum NZE10]|uniref:FAD-binding PCMH-type domain-containing protein n=1 Tax=Dothistroma septosporum (strain NZE10 / CBS 128990) TaxID=675120 RepID=M2WLL5_DOTSN|nr:hypothetical protein DOTSEDRAFT_153101 [Dothistroma septosporum NZE10]
MLPLAALLTVLHFSLAQASQDPLAPPDPAAVIAKYTACIAAAVQGNSSQFVVPTSPNYLSELDIYNLDNIVTPSAIAFPSSAKEVAALVKCAHDAKIAVQPLSGGHSFDNFGLGGSNGSLSINLQNLNSIAYNDADQTLCFGTGNLLGNLTEYLKTVNRTAVFSFIPSIGTGGHFTIGGLGPLSRLYGLAADQIIEAEVVLANGVIVTASENENEDVFFAIKGAGWSFGIVTRFTIKTRDIVQPIPYSYIVPGNFSTSAGVTAGWQGLISQKNLSRSLGSTIYIYEGFALITGQFNGALEDFVQVETESEVQFAIAGVAEPTDNALQTADVLAVFDKLNLTATFGLVGDLSSTGLLKFLPASPANFVLPLVESLARLAPAIESGNIPAVLRGIQQSNDTTLSSILQAFQDNTTVLQSVFTDLRYSGLLEIITNTTDIKILAQLLPKLNLTSIFELVTDVESSPLLSGLPSGSKLSDVFRTLFSSHTPTHFYSKSLKFTENTLQTQDSIKQVFDYLDKTDAGSPLWFVVFDLSGGAINDIAQDATAYYHRDALYWMQSYLVDLTGIVTPSSRLFLDNLNEVAKNATPGVDDSAYPGYVDKALKHAQVAYWGGNVDRLEQIKKDLDPDNVFRNPQSIAVPDEN